MKFYDWNKVAKSYSNDGYSRGVAASDNLMMAHVSLEAGAITSSHNHTYEEIVYVVRGRWKITLGNESIELGANQTLVVPANVEHSSVALEETLAVVCTSFRPEWKDDSDCWLHYNAENHLWAV
ncbi:MAG: cupin domain-containing protein [Pyrinomonadaceae bacterium]